MRRDINIIMKISIIVPVYNAEKTIEYCIDSIITQKTKFEIELILVEDYSTDRSYEICLALKKKYTEIKLYRTNGKGVSAARNTGLSHSTGDVVGFCDSDDIYEKDVFEKVRLFFENKDIDIVIGGFYYSKKDSLNTVVQETHSHNRQRNVEGHLLYNMILNDGRILGSVCNKFYRAESIRDFSFLTELEYCEDLVFNAELVEKNNLKAVIVGYPIYHYIINEESATNNKDRLFTNDSRLKYIVGDGILTSLKMMEVMLAKKKPMSELAAPLKIYPQVLENVRVTDKKAAQNDPVVQEAVSKVDEALGDTGRILVRESGTEPVVRVMVEAPDHDTCQKYVDEVVNVICEKGYKA